jgi:hypothetical protein
VKTPLCFLTLALLAAVFPAGAANLAIRSDFPGGNIVIDGTDGETVRLSPDLRTSKPWFYWYFEVQAEKPGRFTFVLPAGRIGTRGPAVSVDGGETWNWLGVENVTFAIPAAKTPGVTPQDTFAYEFTSAGQKVRFSVGFPYVQSNLDAFLSKAAGNPNLKQSELAKTLGGKSVELLQIGSPGSGKTAMAVAARSHACEALASYVLEGFLGEAMSDSPAGVEFRKKYVLYAVPILDKDGVEAGDQGKNRDPHDHNRDYGTNNLYPEIKALQELAVAQKVQVGIDFHCPALKGDIHEAYHWLGLKIPHISTNIDELSLWLGQERPADANAAINFTSKPPEPPKTENVPFSWHMSYLENALLAVTLESPYARAENVDDARAYGSALLRALVRTELVTADPTSVRGSGSYAAFEKFQKDFTAVSNRPEEAAAMADRVIQDPASSPLYRAHVHLGMATVYLRAKKFSEALSHATAAQKESGATNAQKTSALLSLIAIQTRNPEATVAEVQTAVADLEAAPQSGNAGRFAAYGDLSAYYERNSDLPRALDYARRRLSASHPRDKSGAMLRVAALLDMMNQKDEAIVLRREVVALLRPRLLPTPNGKGMILGVQAGEMFDALNAIPSATREEKIEAATVILNYPVLPQGLKQRAEAWFKENGVTGN